MYSNFGRGFIQFLFRPSPRIGSTNVVPLPFTSEKRFTTQFNNNNQRPQQRFGFLSAPQKCVLLAIAGIDFLRKTFFAFSNLSISVLPEGNIGIFEYVRDRSLSARKLRSLSPEEKEEGEKKSKKKRTPTIEEVNSELMSLKEDIAKVVDNFVGAELITEGSEVAIGLRLLETAAAKKEGHPAALFNLGVIYERGLVGTPRNLERAFGYYERAGELGHGAAKFNLAVMYAKGLHVKRNLETAKKLMYEAALTGLPQARAIVFKKCTKEEK